MTIAPDFGDPFYAKFVDYRDDGLTAPRCEGAGIGVHMIRGAILFAVLSLTVSLLALSCLTDFAPRARPAASARAAAAVDETVVAAEPPPQTSVYRETRLAADAKGQYSAEALVNGSPVRMLVDTGASVVAVSALTAARLGLIASPGPKLKISTANGESTASPVVLNSVSFGGLYMNDVEALILPPQAGETNLLGASFLKRLASVEQRGGALILRQ
jgi:aspartyl protease family protein